jgi:hypothetical protein
MVAAEQWSLTDSSAEQWSLTDSSAEQWSLTLQESGRGGTCLHVPRSESTSQTGHVQTHAAAERVLPPSRVADPAGIWSRRHMSSCAPLGKHLSDRACADTCRGRKSPAAEQGR